MTLSSTGTPWTTATTTNLVVTANTAVITCSGTGATFTSGLFNFNGMSVSMTGSGAQTFTPASSTFANFTRIGTSGNDTISLGGSFTCTGTLTLTGLVTNTLNLVSTLFLTARTVTAAAVNLSYTDFRDFTGAGAAAPFTGTSLGDSYGNSGVTFTPATTQTWQGTSGGNWNDVTKWTSRIPLTQDNVVISSAFTPGQTIVMNVGRAGSNLDASAATGGVTLDVNFGASNTNINGNVTLGAGVAAVTASAGALFGVATRSIPITITTAGVPFSAGLTFVTPLATVTFADNLTTTGSFTHNDGTMDFNGKTITMANFICTSTRTRAITFNGATISLTSTATSTIWNTTNAAMTINDQTGSIVISNASANTRTFAGATLTYGNLTYTVANSPGTLTITGNNAFKNMDIGPGRTMITTAANTNAVNTFNANGYNYGYEYLPGVAANYVSTPDAAALRITGNLDIRAQVSMANWVPGVFLSLVGKWTTSGNQKGYVLQITNTGVIRLAFSLNGSSTGTPADSTVLPGFANGATNWVRATRVAATGVVTFYTSTDGVTWTQLGATVAGATGNLFASTAVVEIGSNDAGTSNLSAVSVYKADIRNNVLDDGTGIQLSANFTTKSFGANTFTEGSSNAATMTINGTLAQAGDGRVALNSSSAGSATTLSRGILDSVNNVWVMHGSLTYNSSNIVLPGTSGNYISMDAKSAIEITGDLEIIGDVSKALWISGSNDHIMARRVNSGSNDSYRLFIDGTGHPALNWSTDGTSGTEGSKICDTVVPFANGTRGQVKATLDVDDGAGNNVVKFYTATDGVNFTQLGSTITTAGTTSIFAGAAALEIGSRDGGTGGISAITIYNLIVKDGIGGTVVANFIPNLSIISCNYLSIKDSTATGTATWYAGMYSVNVSNNSGWIFTGPVWPKRTLSSSRLVTNTRRVTNTRTVAGTRTVI